MTREEIKRAAKKKQLQWSMYGPTIGEVEEFTLDMVRWHNEECAQIAQEYSGLRTAQAIREIKPT